MQLSSRWILFRLEERLPSKKQKNPPYSYKLKQLKTSCSPQEGSILDKKTQGCERLNIWGLFNQWHLVLYHFLCLEMKTTDDSF